MMDKFRVGQTVRVTLKDSEVFGEVFKITEITLGTCMETNTIALFYVVDDPVGSDGISTGFEQHEIEPVYDGDLASTWSECAWKPSWIKSHG
jgi:hypothetical protein